MIASFNARYINSRTPDPENLSETPCAGPFEFIKCDVSLMRNIQQTTSVLSQRIPKLNFLVLSPGLMSTRGRTETPEGIDVKLALHYYGRWKFVQGMLPSLCKAREVGEEAKVMTMLGAGKGGAVELENLDLKKGYSLKAASDTANTNNDIIVSVSDRFYLTYCL